MKRRDLLTMAMTLPLLEGVASLASAAPAVRPDAAPAGPPLVEAAREAFIYCMPLVEVARLNARSAAAGRAVNSFQHMRVLSNPKIQAVTAPNNDTLSTRAFIDLSAGPVQIGLPAMGERYFSLQLMDAYTNTFCVLGTRATGPRGGAYTLVGPTDPCPPRAIRSPTPWVWALGRTLIDGEADLPAAHALQDQLTLKASGAGRTPKAVATADAGWAAFFASAQEQLVENPPPATDDALLERIAILGLKPGGGFDASRFSAAEGEQIAAGFAKGRAESQSVGGIFRRVGDWAYQSAQIGDYGQDYGLRAATCQWGIGALTPQESMYVRGAGEDGGYFYPAGRSYRLRFGKGERPPVGAFWSLTLYRANADGQVFFFDNTINRYSLGDRSGLVTNPDGSLDLWIGPKDPGGARTANWLPAPSDDRFVLLLRAYLPSRAMVDGTYVLPPIQRI
jgi:hypothetical protein